jgi:hypothetical protein
MSKAKFGKEKGKNEKLALIQRPVFDFKSKDKKKKKQFYLILQQLSELTPRNKNIDIDKKLVSLVFLYQAQISKRKKNNTFTHNPH